ncbi:MAG: bifunctional 2-keto-4-hydroxyglutarate aldolase/2-keto-3-deoxy-6-phosphogluconate aldolase [Firmicutes bacterium]|uniref:2-dehydro-3-deoxyphosphogluconate aldolase / (4S)-4-hydroxy-2-oxoglutarate aldolase n=1 Tax=Melghirimyces thermohalophilus TaxID=1236220 RepID=A0A1G6R117_9BACL|nr:bifunctional 2-keto-4-hydroxyglutarate aldolase/2-keto-3-deoxy-6-phosphogluconate aldolase [Melghirimyces thermohalophilus]MDA8352161.1 bifunctional 2-keto-4-hydroxyglutarate aldolase/2-keto-3-deoxy-6-phosphogluconate aldolase [Bacillota bacterium]SDC98329.1 2-dehydro-3-deoxyphosphogluconate aldolase / (4S)-4-hydroxy-2-oxoglutarate aldolase [Melghirimyces thermohalophilus]
MQTYEILHQMISSKLAVVLRGENLDMAEKTAAACVKGGVKTLEVTFTVPKAGQLIETLVDQYDEDVLVGAGTVLDSETARLAILSGARFIVSPAFDIETAKLCNRYHIPYLPGCMTVNEMIEATEYGVSVIKLFPGPSYDPSFIKNVRGPLPYLNIMPTGGITLDNVDAWLKAGAVMVGVGGEITRPAKEGDYDTVEQLAKAFQAKVMGK